MKKIIFVIFIFTLSCSTLFSQEQRQIDSVKKLISNLNSDTARIRNYLILVEWIADTEEWSNHNKTALGIIEKRLKEKINSEEESVINKYKGDALNNLGLFYKETQEFEKAMETYYLSYNLQKKINNLNGQAICLTNIGALEIKTGKAADGIAKLNEALKIFKDKLNDKKNTANVYNQIAKQYVIQGNTEMTIKYLNDALKIHKECNNQSGEVQAYSSFGNLYYNLGDYKSAEEFYEKALRIFIKINDRTNVAQIYINLGLILKHSDKYKSMHYDSLALDIFNKLDDKEGIASAYNNIGTILIELGDATTGKALIIKSYNVIKETGEVHKAGNYLVILANAYHRSKQYDSALYCAEQGSIFADKAGSLGIKRDAALAFSKIYKSKKDFEKALLYYAEYKLLSDSMLNRDSKNLASRQLSRIEFEKREIELKAEQDKKDLKAEEEKRKQNMITTSVTVVLFLVMVLVVIVFRSLRINQKKNRVITEQKALVEEKQKEIIDSIHYAKRIQQSLMPTAKYIAKKLDDLSK